MTKQQLRTEIKNQRNNLTTTAWQEKSLAVLTQLLQSDLYHGAHCIFTFISIHNEVDTRALMRSAWADGKEIAVPITCPGGQMYFVPITQDTPLIKTKYGTLEPISNPKNAIAPTATDLFLVPGLVFDLSGQRYGYGGGFYDRYLEKHPLATPTALTFQFQIHPQPLATQAHDIPMHYLVTEKGWLTCVR